MVLAIFFIGLAVVTPPIEKYIVSAEIEAAPAKALVAGGGEGIDDKNGRVSKVGLQHVAVAGRAAFFQNQGRDDTGSIPSLTPERLRKISERLDICVAREAGEEPYVALVFRDADLQWAKTFVDQLAQQLVRDWNRVSRPTLAMDDSVRKAKWHVQQARHYERKARFDMEESLNAHFEQLGSVVDRVAVHGDSGQFGRFGVSREEGSSVKSARKENPQWKRLQDELGSLRGELSELLMSASPSYPKARRIAQRMEQLEGELSGTSRYVAPGREEAKTGAVKPATASDESQTGIPVAYASAEESDEGRRERGSVVPAEYRRLRKRYTEAIRRREAAERDLSELEAESKREVSRAPASVAHIRRSAVSVGQLGGVPPAGLVLTIGTLALVCGAFMYGWIKTLGRVPRVYSVEQLQRVAAVPLVGRISIDPMPSRVRRRAYWSWGVGVGIRTSEIILLAVILIFFWSVLQESPVLDQLATNPLGAIANRVAGVYRG